MKPIIFMLLIFSTSVFADARTDKIEDFFKQVISLKKQYQKKYSEAVNENFPKYQEITNIDFTIQKLYIEIQTIKFKYLIKKNPNTFNLSKGFNGLMNHGWNTGNDKYLPAINPKYNDIKNEIKRLRIKSKIFKEKRKELRAEMKNSPANQTLKNIRKKAKKEFDTLNEKIIKYNNSIKKDV